MNALMNSLSELNMNVSISLSQLIIFSLKTRKQLLQMFDSKDQHIAQTLRFMLEEWEGKSKKQRTQLYEHIQTMCVEAEENEAQAQKELNQEKAQTKKKTQAKKIAQEETRHSKLFNDDDDLNKIHWMCKREMTCQQIIKLVWSEWFNSTSFASTVSWKFISLSAWKSIVSFAQSLSRFLTSSSASSSLRSSSARDLQRFFTQIASLFPVSSILTSVSVSPAWLFTRDARDLRWKLKQKLTVSFSRSSSRFSTSSTSSLSRSSSAQNLQRFYTQIASLFSVSLILSSIFSTISSTQSSAQDARDLHWKLMQKLSVFSSRFSSSHDSSRSSSHYSSAWDSH